jgi:hypothetical protein
MPNVADGGSVKDLELAKFRDDLDGNVVVATTASSTFALAVSRGDFTNIECFKVSGDIPEFSQSDNQVDVTSATTPALYTFAAAAETLDIVSTSAADTAAGTGAQEVTVIGLIAGYVEATETIATDGVTPVTTSAAFLRVNDMFVGDVGTGGENAGVITATNSTSGDILSTIGAGNGRALQAIYTVPTGKTAYLGVWDISTHTSSGSPATSKECIVMLKQRDSTTKSWIVLRVGGERSDGGHLGGNEVFYEEIPATSDIRVEAEALGNNTAVAASFELVLVTP